MAQAFILAVWPAGGSRSLPSAEWPERSGRLRSGDDVSGDAFQRDASPSHQLVTGTMVISTRRLAARPASVAFEAMG